MGILGNLFGGDGSKEIKEFLGNISAERDETEAHFRNGVERLLGENFDVLPKREAGLSGMGTRVDLYFEHNEVDYLITIKKGVTEQKVKIILGELVILAKNWKPAGDAGKTYVYVMIFGDLDSKQEGHLTPLFQGIGYLSRDDFDIAFVHCPTIKKRRSKKKGS